METTTPLNQKATASAKPADYVGPICMGDVCSSPWYMSTKEIEVLKMMNVLLPDVADNTLKAHRITYWVLWIYVFKSMFAGAVHMFASDGGAQSIGSVKLDGFTQEGADSVVTMFGLWGMEQFVIGFIVLVILLRYKSLLPLAWAVYAIEYAGRALSHTFTPGLDTEHTPPGVMLDTLLVPLSIAMLVLAIYTTKQDGEEGKNLPKSI